MRWRAPGLWVALLATLLAAPAAGRPAALVRPGEASLRGVAETGSLGHALPVARWQQALQPRTTLDRQHAPVWCLVPSDSPDRVSAPRHVVVLEAPFGGRPAGAARHFPLFPTGPPSHS